MLQMSVALGRDLGSFWSMSSICVQVREGGKEGRREERKEDDEGRERKSDGRKEEKRRKRHKESKGAGWREGKKRERRCRKWEEDGPNIKTCKSVIYSPAASVRHCSPPSLAQRKPTGNSDTTGNDIIKASRMLQTFTNLHYLVYKRWEIGTLKCLLETGHLIEDTPESPYVTLGVVGVSLALKRSKVIVVQQ